MTSKKDASKMAAVKNGDHILRLEKKDPNLDAANYFWDMRKESLPFYRAFQFTEQLIKINEDEDEDEDKNDVDDNDNNNNLIIGIDIKVPSKLDIKKSMERNPNSIIIKLLQKRSHHNDHDNNHDNDHNNKDNNIINKSSSSEFEYLNCHQRLVSSEHDKVLINSRFLQDLFGDLSNIVGVNNNSNNNQQKQKQKQKQECMWFRMGNRIIPQYAILYKVRGITCTCKRGSTFDPDHIPIIGDVLDHLGVSSSSSGKRLNITRPLVPVGRLDQESEGLILLTNDGSFSRFCTSPAIGLKKVYRVFVKDKGRRRWEHNTPLHELYQRLRNITDTVKHDNIQQQQNTTPDDDDCCTIENSNNMKAKQIIVDDDSNGRAYSSSSEFRAESCTIIDYATIPWVVSSSGCGGISSGDNNKNKSTTTCCLHALLDIEMTEGKNREVRRLMKSIGFVTHMLARSTIGNSLKWINNNNNNGDNNNNNNNRNNDNDKNPIDDVNWQFHIPTTIEECQKKCNAYELDHRELSNNKNGGSSSLLQLAIENASHPSAFRYLKNSEVDDIFAASSTFNNNNATTKT